MHESCGGQNGVWPHAPESRSSALMRSHALSALSAGHPSSGTLAGGTGPGGGTVTQGQDQVEVGEGTGL